HEFHEGAGEYGENFAWPFFRLAGILDHRFLWKGPPMPAILAFALLAPAFLLQELPDAAALMKQQAAAAQKYHTLQYGGETSLEMVSGPLLGRKTKGEISVYVKNPGKSRVDTRLEGQSAVTIVSDGEFIWTYNSSAKQYTKTA